MFSDNTQTTWKALKRFNAVNSFFVKVLWMMVAFSSLYPRNLNEGQSISRGIVTNNTGVYNTEELTTTDVLSHQALPR